MNILFVPEILRKIRDKNRQQKALEEFKDEMLTTFGFVSLILLAGGIATMGLIRGQVALIIGAMVITPLVTPFVGISLGIVTRRWDIFKKSLRQAILGSFLFFGIAHALTTLIQKYDSDTLINVTNINIGLPEIIVAICAGLVAALAFASEKIQSRISGAAIALSLAPPLAVSSIDLALGRMDTFSEGLILFGINVAGLVVMSLLVFMLFGFRTGESVAE